MGGTTVVTAAGRALPTPGPECFATTLPPSLRHGQCGDVVGRGAPDARTNTGVVVEFPRCHVAEGFSAHSGHKGVEPFNAAPDGRRIDGRAEQIWNAPAVAFHPACIAAVRDAALAQGLSARELVSGAGHDAVYMARVVPTAMIFVPCKDGVSHNEAEYAAPEACTDGANVLLHAVLARANA